MTKKLRSFVVSLLVLIALGFASLPGNSRYDLGVPAGPNRRVERPRGGLSLGSILLIIIVLSLVALAVAKWLGLI